MRNARLDGDNVLHLDEDTRPVQVSLPAFHLRTCVYLEVSNDGRLIITGGADCVHSIRGWGMEEKVVVEPGSPEEAARRIQASWEKENG